MLKRISVEHLCSGMFLHEMCGSWLDHPFWRTSFLLEDPKDIARILDSNVREVWIDTSKGLDVEAGQSVEEADAEIERELRPAAAMQSRPKRMAIELEIDQAAKICLKAKQAVTSMFSEARLGKAVNANDVLPLVEEISASVMRNPDALISMARLKTKDDYTYLHSVAVCALMLSLSRQLGLDEATTRELGMGGLLHDIGKMAVPSDVLNKPSSLTDQEFSVMRGHPEAGHRMLREGKGVGEIPLEVCLHHHEKVDGSGYPHHLKDAEISRYAKMGAVCDVYDAITSNRPYRDGWPPAEALRKMAEWRRGHFDETVFQAFVKCVGIYPAGGLVRLASERLAIVLEQSGTSLLAPVVKVFFSIKSNMRIVPETVDLARPGAQDKIASFEDPGKWGIANIDALWREFAGKPA
jgi:putative nucleotidyltransferase with HDIG domain